MSALAKELDYQEAISYKPATKKAQKHELKKVLREERKIGTMSRGAIIWYLICKDITFYAFLGWTVTITAWILTLHK